MGFFSYLTSDSNEPIKNIYTGDCRTVYMLQPGDEPNIREPSYGGYGEFGGCDVFVWLTEHNTVNNKGDWDSKRLQGLNIFFSEEKEKFPLKFSFDKNAVYEDLPAAKSDPSQGYFYGDEDDDNAEIKV